MAQPGTDTDSYRAAVLQLFQHRLQHGETLTLEPALRVIYSIDRAWPSSAKAR